MKKDILPLGSVVLLNGGTKKVMIIGYCMKTPEKPNKMYDYCGCVFPEEVLRSDVTCVFDHEQIKEALEEYGTAGQVIEINAPAQEIFTLAKNAIVIDDYVDAGSLKIEKNVESSTQDPTTFNFTITFTRENGLPLNGYYELINADGNLQTVKLEEGKLSFSLKDDKS